MKIDKDIKKVSRDMQLTSIKCCSALLRNDFESYRSEHSQYLIFKADLAVLESKRTAILNQNRNT